jgi:hypothetical protein
MLSVSLCVDSIDIIPARGTHHINLAETGMLTSIAALVTLTMVGIHSIVFHNTQLIRALR